MVGDNTGDRVNATTGASPSIRMDGGDHGVGLGFHTGLGVVTSTLIDGADGSLGENTGCGSIGAKLGDKFWSGSVGIIVNERIDGTRLGESEGMKLDESEGISLARPENVDGRIDGTKLGESEGISLESKDGPKLEVVASLTDFEGSDGTGVGKLLGSSDGIIDSACPSS